MFTEQKVNVSGNIQRMLWDRVLAIMGENCMIRSLHIMGSNILAGILGTFVANQIFVCYELCYDGYNNTTITASLNMTDENNVNQRSIYKDNVTWQPVLAQARFVPDYNYITNFYFGRVTAANFVSYSFTGFIVTR